MGEIVLLQSLLPEKPTSWKNSGRRLSEQLSEEDGGLPEELPECVPKGRVSSLFRRKILPEDHLLLTEEPSSGSAFVNDFFK